MKTSVINFVEVFTDCPGGRLRVNGDYSGEQFREDVLKPALTTHEKVTLNLTGAYGFPSSFIDEAFGVLVEHLGYDLVRSKLVIQIDDDPLALKEIEEAMLAHTKAK